MRTRGSDIIMDLSHPAGVSLPHIVCIFMILFFGFTFRHAEASYLKNVPQTLIQPDGLVLKCYATGDEFYHWLHDANQFTIVQDSVTGFYVYAKKASGRLIATSLIAGQSDPSAAGIVPGENLSPAQVLDFRNNSFHVPVLKGATLVNTTGTLNNIVIFIRFSDQSEFSDPVSRYGNAFNATGTPSMAEYFRQVSGSQLTVNTSLFPQQGGSSVVSYQDAKSRNFYCRYNSVTNPDGYQTETERYDREMKLLKSATESVKGQIEATGLNFDIDNNGEIDNICYIVQGATDGWADLLWPHQFMLYAFNVSIGNAKVWNYNLQVTQTFGVNVLCHEMLHSLGFPDLYRYTDNTVTPVSSWDIMASPTDPPQQPGVYMKQKYGNWVSAIPEISANGTYSLKPLSNDPFAGYRINSPNSTSEYFVVEYRKTEGMLESQLLGSGLIIYRVNPSINGNSYGPADEVYVFRPNGTISSNGNLAEAFLSAGSGRTTFGNGSATGCFLTNGAPGGIQITNIGAAGETISFTVTIGNTQPPVLAVTPASWETGSSAASNTFSVTNSGSGSMSWTASVISGSNWAHITSGTSGNNAGSIAVSTDVNSASASRTAIITVTAPDATGGTKTISILQAASPAILSITPEIRNIRADGGTTSFAVSNTGGGTISWTSTVTTGNTWAHITAGTSGNNSGTITVTADPNPDNEIREATVTVTEMGNPTSAKTLAIIQEANKPVIGVDRSSADVLTSGGLVQFSVSNSGGGYMSWSASVASGAAWLKITSGSSGINSGVIRLQAEANPGIARIATLVISAPGATVHQMTLTVSQTARPAELEIDPEMQTVDYGGASVNFGVFKSGAGSVAWHAEVTTGSSWAHITSGATGTDDGKINVDVDPNNNEPRTSIITVTSSDPAIVTKIITIMQDITNGIGTVKSDKQVTVYPNPSEREFNIRIDGYDGTEKKLEIINTNGQVETESILNQSVSTIDCSSLAKGIYMFRITSANQPVSLIRVVRN